jgi:hypothetical protein
MNTLEKIKEQGLTADKLFEQMGRRAIRKDCGGIRLMYRHTRLNRQQDSFC